jgi:hypothetical protein
VLFLLFGSRASGKTTALNALRGRVSRLAVHDFDEVRVPPGATKGWRQSSDEEWVQRALGYQREGTDLLLGGQVPFGELLATPSAASLDAISACLIDCDDNTRLARMRARGPEWLRRTGGDLQSYLNWAEWMRHHASDRGSRVEVLRHSIDAEMRWERWQDWEAGDPRWHVRVLDTAALPVQDVANALVEWITAERALLRRGQHRSAASPYSHSRL